MNKFLKGLFFIAIIVLIGFTIFFVTNKNISKKDVQEKEEKTEDQDQIISNIRIGVADIDTFNPILSKNRNIYEYLNTVYEPLVELDERYIPRYKLAENIKKQDDITYIVTLKNANFHNDIPLNASDVQFTINTITRQKTIYYENVKNIVSTKVLNNNSIQLNLRKKDDFFPYNLTFPIMQKQEIEFFLDNKKYPFPVGTGLYKFKEQRNNSVIYELNTKYWDETKLKKANIKEIHIQKYKSIGSVYNAFKSGNVDIINSKNKNYVKQIGTYGYRDIEYKGREFNFLAFNTKVVPREIRHAVSLYLDKEKIISKMGYAQTKSSLPMDFGHWSVAKNIDLEYNPKKAKKILENAGYILKNGKWQKGNRNIRYNIIVNSANGLQKSIGKNISEELKKAGLDIYVQELSESIYRQKLENRDYSLLIAGIRTSFSTEQEIFLSEDNIFNLQDEEIKKIYNEISNYDKMENTFNEMIPKYTKIYDILKKELPFIGISRNTNHLIISVGLHIPKTPNMTNILYNIEDWYRK